MMSLETLSTDTITADHTPSSTQERLKPSQLLSFIETVKRLREDYRPLTQEEHDLLASFPGWGPYAPAFELKPKDEHWRAIGAGLRMVLGPEGYEAASAATPTSYFTAPTISTAIWELAERLGFAGGAVLEPGCGSGQLLLAAPKDLTLHFTGVEQEPFSASVAQLLAPSAHIIQAPLQEEPLAEDAFDVIVGNVPFAEVHVFDRTLPFKHKLSLHNYFLFRSLQALRPGGLAILVTSRYTLDAAKTAAREEIAKLGVLLGALRLPSGGHRWAKTQVVTDIVIFQRRFPGQMWEGEEWQQTTTIPCAGGEVEANAYFATHPEQILGTLSVGHGMYHEQQLQVTAPDDLSGALALALDRIVKSATEHRSLYIPRLDPTQLPSSVLYSQREDGLKEGCFYVLPHTGLVEIAQGSPVPVTRHIAELTALVHLRDAALALIEAERDYSKGDDELLPLRQLLNGRYDSYVKQFGPIHESKLVRSVDKTTGEEQISRRLKPVMSAFRKDEHYPLILSLESYNDETKQAHKSAIFRERVNHPPIYKETAESPEEVIALSLDRFGKLDLPFMAKAVGRETSEIPAYLSELAYFDPEAQTWEIAPLYLSGNVFRKLRVARQASETDPSLLRNIEALEAVQPHSIPPEEIKVLLGAPWLPAETIQAFSQELLHVAPDITRDRVTGRWEVAPPLGYSFSVQATSQWGTKRVSAFKLLEHLLNHKTTMVEDEDADGKKHVNSEETMLAQQKKRELQARFTEWIWEDNVRTKTLATLYNEIYNNLVPTCFTGAHLSFPGMDSSWQGKLYSWQCDFIARMISQRSALCAYPVGAGKTKIQVAGAMTLRRMKLVSKAAVVVPNHLIEQITAEAKQLYPSANILMISREELAREKRRIFMARIATGDHDLVIMTHSAFEAISVHPETRRAYIHRQVADYKKVLSSIDPKSENRADQRLIKRIEKQIAQMREKLSELLSGNHDPGITFEMLGISYLIVDEVHLHKNLGLPTNQEKLAVQPSQRAQDLLMKLQWLEQHNGKRPFCSFFTATPISNSMVEALVMLWYLNRALLSEYEIKGVDDFASLYIESEEKIEVTPNGAGFRLYERPANFINLPEFLHLFTSVTDIRSPDILAENRPDRLEHTVSVEPTEEVVAFVDSLVTRSEKLQGGNPLSINGKEDNMLWVTGDGRKAALWMGLHGKPEQRPAKLVAIADQMATVYHRWQEKADYLPGPYKSLQIGFCDQGTPNPEKGDQVYGELKRLLIERGIPTSGIRFIHEAESDAAKAALFEQCRNGGVAILLGSTAKLGTGTNIQTRCAAIHHCDAPWRPDEVEQREGRGQRPGNLYPVVEVFYYVQRRTFDSYSWQILANKARFFNQIRSQAVTSREMSYSDDSALTYGQVKAAATGDVLLLEHANVTLSVDAFSRLHASFKRARERDQQEARSLRENADSLEKYLKRNLQVEQTATAYTGAHPYLSPDRRLLGSKEAQRECIAAEIGKAIAEQMTRNLGSWKGVSVFFKVRPLTTHPYSLALLDPYHGIDITCQPQWLEQENQWRFGWKIEQVFANLSGVIENQAAEIALLLKKADEFEKQSKAIYPKFAEWQAALSRKKDLDAYIAAAAKAQTEDDIKQVAEMRAQLLASAPAHLLERPQAKNTARVVLPPRHPQTNAVSTTQIEVAEIKPDEPSIEEVVRTIKQSVVVGSKATVVFGQPLPKKAGKPANKQAKPAGRSNGTPAQACSSKTREQGSTLWDLVMQSEQGEGTASPSSTSSPQPLSLWGD